MSQRSPFEINAITGQRDDLSPENLLTYIQNLDGQADARTIQSGYDSIKPDDPIWIYSKRQQEIFGLASAIDVNANGRRSRLNLRWDNPATAMLATRPIPRSRFVHAPNHPLRASEEAVRQLLYWLGSFSVEDLGVPDSKQGVRIRQLAWRTRRQGQPDFRGDLLRHYDKKCAVSRYDVEVVLEAAHIEPYTGPHSNTLDNGLLLRADIHALFDEHLIGFDSSNRIVLSPIISDSKYAKELANVTLFQPESVPVRPSRDRLEIHLSNLIT